MDMTFLAKFFVFSVFVAIAYSRSLFSENVPILQVLDTNCSCDWRYFNHYETKGCLVERTNSCGCPEKFLCPNQTEETSRKVCIYQNKEYTVGSKIISSDLCQVCRCRDGVPPYISCVTRECPELNKTPGQDCHLVYLENKCCPVGVECFEKEIAVASNKTCEYDGRLYPFGSKIYPVDDPCKTCICNENWNDDDNSTCYQHDCMFEKNKIKLDAGCIPVYYESRCCPVEFYCPSGHNFSYAVLSSNESADNHSVSYENQCTFDGQVSAVGEELFIENPCVKCTCVAPPDFTCVHQTCPPPPSEESCYANFISGECCPTYECMLGDVEPHPAGCPTPLCEDSSCHIEIPQGHECPTCVCKERVSEMEHNNLEQVQQISQNIEQEQVQQSFEFTNNLEESSEDELQMMPKRSEDSEGQLSVMEKMMLPEFDDVDQYSEGLRELEESSFEDISSTETDSTVSEEAIQVAEEEHSTSQPELDLDDAYNISVSNQSEKVLQKRSDVSDVANSQTEVMPVQQNVFQPELQEDIEREGVDSDGKSTDFADELESFKNKIFSKNKTIINEIIKIDHVVKVPPGCPTPMCEGPWCKIGIPEGEKCPTCICKRRIDNEP